jgi:hypothetical protein
MHQPDRLTVVIAHRDPFLSAGLARQLGNLTELEPVVCGPELGQRSLAVIRETSLLLTTTRDYNCSDQIAGGGIVS